MISIIVGVVFFLIAFFALRSICGDVTVFISLFFTVWIVCLTECIGALYIIEKPVSEYTKICEVTEESDNQLLSYTSNENTYSVFNKDKCKTYSVSEKNCTFVKDVTKGNEYVEVCEYTTDKLIFFQ